MSPLNPLTSVKPPSLLMNSTLVVFLASSAVFSSPVLLSLKLGSKPAKKPSRYFWRTGVRYASTVVEVPRATMRIMGREDEDAEMCSKPIDSAIETIWRSWSEQERLGQRRTESSIRGYLPGKVNAWMRTMASDR